MIHHYNLIYHIYLSTVELENSYDNCSSLKNRTVGENKNCQDYLQGHQCSSL